MGFIILQPVLPLYMVQYLKMNYTNNFLRLGFTEEDIKDGGSDHLIDAIIAWGDAKAIQSRVQAHHAAGADHVCIQALCADTRALPLREWRELAGTLIH
jgi:hypothetical protein